MDPHADKSPLADKSHLAKIIAQHAQTARLLGVDFIPVYSRAGAAPFIEVEEAPEPQTHEPHAAAAHATSPTPAQPWALQPQRNISRAELFKSESKPAARPAPRTTPHTPSPAASPGEPTPAPDGVPGDKPLDRDTSQAALDVLRDDYIAAAPHAPFIKSFTNIVFGEGDPCARVMFIGEAPGEEEDRTGRPFVGRAGQLLDKMILAMGLSREQVYIANVMKVRPPNNATPTPEEAAASSPFLFRQISIVKPDAIVALGLPSARLLLCTMQSMASMRGSWWAFRDAVSTPLRIIPVMPTYHPAYVLRSYNEDTRGKVWSDLCQVLTRLGMPVPKKGSASPG